MLFLAPETILGAAKQRDEDQIWLRFRMQKILEPNEVSASLIFSPKENFRANWS
jgi:hypothetical protein